jgi:signal transduction histidine kinase
MHNSINPIPENELQRLLSLAELDLDYANLEENFKDLTLLAAKIAGTEISLINIIDSYTQWTLGSHGLAVKQIPREDSVCQYTIMDTSSYEVRDLSADPRFKDKFYVDGPLALRYYHGFPLKTDQGFNVGALCVLDSKVSPLSEDKVQLLEIIAETIVKRLKGYSAFHSLQEKLQASEASKRKVAHDIRGPLGGIIGLSEIILDQGATTNIEEVIEFVGLINNSSKSLLDLTDEILSDGKQTGLAEDNFNLAIFKKKLEELYAPQAKYKNIDLKVTVNPHFAEVPFSRDQLLQISGNLISNAIKFTPHNGKITVELDLIRGQERQLLKIVVADTGIGMEGNILNGINQGNCHSTTGTAGEKGFGIGLNVVQHLVKELKGSLSVEANAKCGTTFTVVLPQPANHRAENVANTTDGKHLNGSGAANQP